MTLLTLAARTVRHHARSYAAFFLSSTFAVWLFYQYAALVMHPAFGGDAMPDAMRQMAVAVEYVVGLFSLMFITYSHSAFLKARKKDLALMTLLGMLPGQIARTVAYEIGLIGAGAVAGGVAVGTVTLKLFFLGISRALDLPDPIPFRFSLDAVLLTAAVYLAIFAVLGLTGLVAVRRLSIAELIRDAVRPKAPPRFSIWLAALAVGCIGYGYALAFGYEGVGQGQSVVLMIMLLLLVGTYLLFTQGSVLVLKLLQSNRRLYYRQTNLLTLSQLVYKLKDNARMLYIVASLSSILLVVSGVSYGAYRTTTEKALGRGPWGLSVLGEPNGLTPERTLAILQAEGAVATGDVHVRLLPVDLGQERQGAVLSQSDYARWVAQVPGAPGAGPVAVRPGYARVVSPLSRFGNGQPLTLTLAGGEAVTLPVEPMVEAQVFNDHPALYTVVVVADATFADLQARAGAGAAVTLHGYNFQDWRSSEGAVARVEAGAGRGGRPYRAQPEVRSTLREYQEYRQANGYILFLGSFVSLLFFLACGNMLYFKLFTEMQEDRRQFQALHKVGVSLDEIRSVVSTQSLVIFFAPLLVAGANAAVFLRMFESVHREMWKASTAVTLLYALLCGAYYLVIRRSVTAGLQ